MSPLAASPSGVRPVAGSSALRRCSRSLALAIWASRLSGSRAPDPRSTSRSLPDSDRPARSANRRTVRAPSRRRSEPLTNLDRERTRRNRACGEPWSQESRSPDDDSASWRKSPRAQPSGLRSSSLGRWRWRKGSSGWGIKLMRDGLSSWCAACHREATRRWRADHRDEINEARRVVPRFVYDPASRRTVPNPSPRPKSKVR